MLSSNKQLFQGDPLSHALLSHIPTLPLSITHFPNTLSVIKEHMVCMDMRKNTVKWCLGGKKTKTGERQGKNKVKKEDRQERQDEEMIAQITGYRLMSCQMLLLSCQFFKRGYLKIQCV